MSLALFYCLNTNVAAFYAVTWLVDPPFDVFCFYKQTKCFSLHLSKNVA